jgi:hypothetical protein
MLLVLALLRSWKRLASGESARRNLLPRRMLTARYFAGRRERRRAGESPLAIVIALHYGTVNRSRQHGLLPLAVTGLDLRFVECGATRDLAAAALMKGLGEGLPTNLDFLRHGAHLLATQWQRGSDLDYKTTHFSDVNDGVGCDFGPRLRWHNSL